MSSIAVKALRRGERLIRDRVTPLNRRPIILLGKGKSGTTAIAALLAQATGKSVALDIPALFVDGLRPLLRGESHLRRVIRRQRIAFSKDIIKQPTLTWVHDQLRDCFPEAKFAMIVRDPRDNIRSVFDRMGIPGNLDDLTTEQIEAIHPGWRWHFAEPELLGLTGANYIELSAQRWNRAVDIYMANADRMLLIRYEDFLRDRISAIASIAERFGLPVINDIAPSVDRQYQPRGKDRGRDPREFFGERNLALIEGICGSRMRQLGYKAAAGVAPACTSASTSR